MKLLNNYIVRWAAFFLLLIVVGLMVDNNYALDILITIVFYAGMASAWNIVGGYAGQVSVGHVAFLGLGAYTSTILFLKLNITPLIGIFAGGIVAMLLALCIGFLTIRLRGPFFTLSTIAIAEILLILAVRFHDLTGGSEGLNIPYRPALYNFVFKSYFTYYLIFVLLMACIVGVLCYINRSRVGYYLRAVREDETAASSLGVDVFKSKLIALLISAFFTGVGGALYAQYLLFIDPHTVFTVAFSTKVAALSIVGGIGTVLGPIIGSFILTPLEIFLRSMLGGTYQGLYLLIYGVIMVTVILIIPKGIYGALRDFFKKQRKQRSHELSSGE